MSILKGSFINLLKKSPKSYYSAKLSTVKNYLNKDFHSQHFNTSNLILGNYIKNSTKFKSGMKNDSFKLASFTNLPGILRQVDRNSMAASVEARLPFLDYRLVELLFSLPFTYMFKNGYTKYAYRKSMEGIIPNEVLWRKSKEGFKMPEYDILRKNKDYVLSILDSHKHDSFLNISLVKEQYLKSINNKLKYNNIIWRSINYLIWKDLYHN
jgi:asparagine synthase (glutamine-hydrolysing)